MTLSQLALPLRAALARLRSRARAAALALGASRIVAYLLAACALLFAADYLLRLPVEARRVALAALAISLAVEAYRRIVRPLAARLPDARLAARVERAFPVFQDRLVSSLDFAAEPRDPENEDSPELMREVVEETISLARTVPFAKVVRLRPAARWGAAALLLLGAGAAAAGSQPELFSIFLQRDLLGRDVSWPRRTTLLVEGMDPGVPRAVTRGRETTIAVLAEGSAPDRVEFTYWEEHAPAEGMERIELEPAADDPHRFAITLPVYGSYRFTVTGGDDTRALEYRIEALRPPSLLSIRVECEFPAYLGRPPESLVGGDQRVPQGTKARIVVQADAETARAALGLGADAPVEMASSGPHLFAHELIVEKDVRYSVRLSGTNGQENDAGADSFVLRSVKDQAPVVRIHAPGERAERLATGVVLIAFTARDDHRVEGARFLFSVREGPERSLPLGDVAAPEARAMRAPGSTPELLGGVVAIDLALLRRDDGQTLGRGDSIRYRVEATDSSGKVQDTTPRRIEIVPEEDLARTVEGRQQNLHEGVAGATQRAAEVRGLLATAKDALAGSSPSVDEARSVGRKAQALQGRLAQDLSRLASQSKEIANLYVLNRLDDRSGADQALPWFERHLLERVGDSGAPFDGTLYRALWTAILERSLNAAGSLAKLLEMADLSDRLGVDHGPAAYRETDRLGFASDPEVARDAVAAAAGELARIEEGLARLARLMREWQSYEGVVRLFKSLAEAERKVTDEVEHLNGTK